MTGLTLHDLQASVLDLTAFKELDDYHDIGASFLKFLEENSPTRIISPSQPNYIFYQYPNEYANRITRPLNTHLFIEDFRIFETAFDRFATFIDDLHRHQDTILERPGIAEYVETREINQIVYTVQQSIGSIGDSFTDANQARKRIGQLFEKLIKLLIQKVGLECEPRTIKIPIPNYPGYNMPYELDVVFSRNRAVVTSETQFIYPNEVVGSIKTTSKDRIDKIFLDKYLLTKLLERNIPVIAIFLHDVQRARKGNSIFGINSTFKTNHFLGYTVALNKLDGVYYVDPRPEMASNIRLQEQIHDFQQLLVHDIWVLSK